MIREAYQETTQKLLAACLDLYRDRLISLVLFGSVGRGTPSPQSDIDFIVVARDLPRGRLNRIREFQVVEEQLEPWLRSLAKRGVHISLSPVFKTPEEVEKGSLLFLDLVDDAVLLHDQDNFFQKHLERLASRLEELGAYKVIRGGRWHWVLKPDYRPGEVFEI